MNPFSFGKNLARSITAFGGKHYFCKSRATVETFSTWHTNAALKHLHSSHLWQFAGNIRLNSAADRGFPFGNKHNSIRCRMPTSMLRKWSVRHRMRLPIRQQNLLFDHGTATRNLQRMRQHLNSHIFDTPNCQKHFVD